MDQEIRTNKLEDRKSAVISACSFRQVVPVIRYVQPVMHLLFGELNGVGLTTDLLAV